MALCFLLLVSLFDDGKSVRPVQADDLAADFLASVAYHGNVTMFYTMYR